VKRLPFACWILLAAALLSCGREGNPGGTATPATTVAPTAQANATPTAPLEPTKPPSTPRPTQTLWPTATTSPITTATSTAPPTTFKVHFIDAGQGDAILVEAGDADILVDGGPSGSAVLSYLAGQHVPDIDLLVATHPHADHVGGLDDVLAQYEVREVWTNGATATTQTYKDFAAAVAAEGAVEREIKRGYSTQFGGMTLTALDPVDPLTGDANGDSIVLRLSCGSVDVLLAGDATADSEASMLADPSLVLGADVLKVGHHGSSTSTTNAFLDAVTPKDAVISVGAGNTYGHPAQDTLNRLAAHGATIYRTDLNGTVVLTLTAIRTRSAPPGWLRCLNRPVRPQGRRRHPQPQPPPPIARETSTTAGTSQRVLRSWPSSTPAPATPTGSTGTTMGRHARAFVSEQQAVWHSTLRVHGVSSLVRTAQCANAPDTDGVFAPHRWGM